MNALVASVIRTYTPIIVGYLGAWLIMIHVPVLPELEVLLTAAVGAGLSLAYYTLVRVLEQQWPSLGILLGLTASPDTYTKGDATTVEVPVPVSAAPVVVESEPVTAEAPGAVPVA